MEPSSEISRVLREAQAEARRRRSIVSPETAFRRRVEEREVVAREELLAQQREEEQRRKEDHRRERLRGDALRNIQEDILPAVHILEDQIDEGVSSFLGTEDYFEMATHLQTVQEGIYALAAERDNLALVLETLSAEGAIAEDVRTVETATRSVESLQKYVHEKLDLLFAMSQSAEIRLSELGAQEVVNMFDSLFETGTQKFLYPPTTVELEMETALDEEMAQLLEEEEREREREREFEESERLARRLEEEEVGPLLLPPTPRRRVSPPRRPISPPLVREEELDRALFLIEAYQGLPEREIESILREEGLDEITIATALSYMY